MPPHLPADCSSAPPPERDAVEALISQTRRLRGGVDAVRPDAAREVDDPEARWRRALCDLAVHQLDDLGRQLGQLREGLPFDEEPDRVAPVPPPAEPPAPRGSLLSRVGSAEWNLLTDEVDWSDELYAIFGRSVEDGPLSLDELPSLVLEEDQALLTAMVTDCLVDGRPIDGEFRVVRPEGTRRTLHMMGEPVLAADGSTASMWAVLRDVSALRRSRSAVRESHESLRRQREITRTERRLAVELHETVLPPWRGPLRLPRDGRLSLDLAAHYLPARAGEFIGGCWYDALPLSRERTLLSAGELTGRGVSAVSGVATLLGAVRGMAVAGVEPGLLMDRLDHLLDTSAQPALGSALCCVFDPHAGVLTWAQAGHPAPVLFRDGVGRPLERPEGVLLGATPGAGYGQAQVELHPGDLLVLHTEGLAGGTPDRARPADGTAASRALTALAPRLGAARGTRDCLRIVVEEFGEPAGEGDACVLIARVGS